MRSVAALLAGSAFAAACAAAPPPAASAGSEHHHHELPLPPVGPSVTVVFGEQRVDVALQSLGPEGASVPLLELWKRALPSENPTPLHFDLFGSDGFHPSSRPPCQSLLNAAQIAAARIDVTTHDVTFDDSVKLPGCYHVHAVVRFEATR